MISFILHIYVSRMYMSPVDEGEIKHCTVQYKRSEKVTQK